MKWGNAVPIAHKKTKPQDKKRKEKKEDGKQEKYSAFNRSLLFKKRSRKK